MDRIKTVVLPVLVAAFPPDHPHPRGLRAHGHDLRRLRGAAWPTLVGAVVHGGGDLRGLGRVPGGFHAGGRLRPRLGVRHHPFYGLSLLERFRRIGAKRFYVIYALCDETFSIEYASRPPQGVDDGWFMFWISLLNQFYWVLGCTLGALFGAVLPVQIEGISFAMTALFMVIFLDQWTREASHAVALAGFAASVAALAVFGADTFIVPALVLILVVAVAMRRWVEPACAATDLDGAEAISNGGAGAGDGTCSPCVRSHDVQDQVEARDEPSGTGSSTGAKGRSEEFARAASDPAYEEER